MDWKTDKKIPIRFYLRKQIIGGKRVGKVQILYVYKNFHGNIEGVVRANSTRKAQAKVREKFPDAEFFRVK